MQTRTPIVSGQFYPSDVNELKAMIKNFLDKTKVERRNSIGIVAPHAGYVYCGKTAASVYNSVAHGFDTVIIIGPNHSGIGEVSTSLETWKTPLGLVKPDEDFINQISKDSIILEDPKSHSMEHSIEVQLPWLQYRFEDFRIVPISINPIFYDIDTCKEIGTKISETATYLRRKILMVASSDFTHYGSMYGYEPFEGSDKEILNKIKEADMEVINQILNLKPVDVINTCEEKKLTICGYGAIASMLFAARDLKAKKGELIDYSTSFEVSKNIDAVVGYAGISIV
ncbi:AmmeMemoRadiSam system protein B [Candidatus Micrarchaeota archaeon RBG_16_36_9]|nr:MAG: AmmeMemoRadiSam system protein B [Candidatus Micrarchaeota archaeon RBG_16_36_9]